MAEGFCAKFNNATQRVFGNTVLPVVYVWETNDSVNPWYAEARLLKGNDLVAKFPQASAPKRQLAKEIAANAAYQALLVQYPNIDLINV